MPLQDGDWFLVNNGSESRKIRADKLFSGIADDWTVLIQEDTVSKRCKVSQLIEKASDTRYMLVNQGSTSYKIKSSTVVGQYGKSLTDIITNVGFATGINYNQYSVVWDLKRNQPYTGGFKPGTNPSFDQVYDGNENTQMYCYQVGEEISFRLIPPRPIIVKGQVEIKAGFNNESRLGQLKINGIVVREFSAHDIEPAWFSASFSGKINTIEIRQKEYSTKSFGVAAFRIDGEYLINNKQVTELTFSSNKGLNDFTYNDIVDQVDRIGNLTIPRATGHVGEVYGNKMSLLKIESNWAVGNYIELPEL